MKGSEEYGYMVRSNQETIAKFIGKCQHSKSRLLVVWVNRVKVSDGESIRRVWIDGRGKFRRNRWKKE